MTNYVLGFRRASTAGMLLIASIVLNLHIFADAWAENSQTAVLVNHPSEDSTPFLVHFTNPEHSEIEIVPRNNSSEGVRFKLETIPRNTSYFHWTFNEEGLGKWSNKKRVSKVELESRLKNGMGTTGGGLYASLDSVDSISFGSQVAVFTAPKDLKKLPA